MAEHMTIIQAWQEVISLNNKINLFETLRDVNGNVKSSKAKEILVQGGFINSDSMINVIMKKDEYTDKLKSLYDSKKAYEEYIEKEKRGEVTMEDVKQYLDKKYKVKER